MSTTWTPPFFRSCKHHPECTVNTSRACLGRVNTSFHANYRRNTPGCSSRIDARPTCVRCVPNWRPVNRPPRGRRASLAQPVALPSCRGRDVSPKRLHRPSSRILRVARVLRMVLPLCHSGLPWSSYASGNYAANFLRTARESTAPAQRAADVHSARLAHANLKKLKGVSRARSPCVQGTPPYRALVIRACALVLGQAVDH